MVVLRTLGSLNLLDDQGNEVTPILSQPKRFALLVYLSAARPRTFHRRDTLLALFWPEGEGSQARNALSQSLSYLRRHLPPEVLLSRGATEVGVDPEMLQLDVGEFEKALAEGRLADALEYYRGDFLKGFHLNGSWDFEEWVEGERVRLREEAAAAAWGLAREQVERGATVEAERTAQRALSLVGSDEAPVRDFMARLARAGERGAALRLFDRFSTVLEEGMGLHPSLRTEAVAEGIRSGGESPGQKEVEASEIHPAGSPDQEGSASPDQPVRDPTGPAANPVSPGSGWKPSPLFLRIPLWSGGSGRVTLGLIVAVLSMLTLFVVARPESSFPPAARLIVLPPGSRGEVAPDVVMAGMHRNLISKLNQVPGIAAVPRYASVAWEESETPLKEFASRVGADAVVEWEGRSSTDSIWISASLYRIEPAGALLWAGEVAGSALDPSELSGRLVVGLAGGIGLTLSEAIIADLMHSQPLDPRVNLALESGWYALEGRSADSFERAILSFDRALELDSTSADAYAGRSIARSWQAFFYFKAGGEMGPLARVDAEKALALDGSLPEAHLAAALVKYGFDWDWDGAEEEVLEALSRDDSLVEALILHGFLLRDTGRLEEALGPIGRARDLNPYDRRTRIAWARMLCRAGRMDESLQEHREILEIWPEWPLGQFYLAQSLEQVGRVSEAGRIYHQLYHAHREQDIEYGTAALALMGAAFARMGEEQAADEILEDLLRHREMGDPVPPETIAWVTAALGRVDQAMEWLLRAYRQDEHGLVYLKILSCLDPLRNDPRFIELEEKVFGEYAAR